MWQSDTAVCGFTVIFMNKKGQKILQICCKNSFDLNSMVYPIPYELMFTNDI